eukprot:2190685-Pyramimonas_sp.AAC.1
MLSRSLQWRACSSPPCEFQNRACPAAGGRSGRGGLAATGLAGPRLGGVEHLNRTVHGRLEGPYP